jgi:shikimate kinase
MQSIITLIGFSGSGKSSVGSALAKRLKVPFSDTDAIIEETEGRSVSQIFAEQGEAFFRKIEKQLIATLLAESDSGGVIALGGGAFEDSDSRRLIRDHSTVVLLSCSQRELYRRLKDQTDRPLLGGSRRTGSATGREIRSDIKNLLKRRRPHYLMADLVISTTNRTVDETAIQIARRLKIHHGSSKSTT